MTARASSPRSRAALIEEAVGAYMDLFVMMQSAAFSHWLMHELTFAQARALILLAAHGTLTVGELARILDVGKSTASILAQQLVEKGLVNRGEAPHDRRVAVLRLSERGAELGAGRRRQREAQWRRWMGRLTDRELAALRLGLSSFRRVAGSEIAVERGVIASVKKRAGSRRRSAVLI